MTSCEQFLIVSAVSASVSAMARHRIDTIMKNWMRIRVVWLVKMDVWLIEDASCIDGERLR